MAAPLEREIAPAAARRDLIRMALLGILGDIHGNSEALGAVLAAFDRRGIRQLVCVGDIVGYNADPDECAALLRERRAMSIAGNHELIGLGRLGFERCANNAKYSLKRTRRSLAPETASWLSSLPPSLLIGERIAVVHGGVRDVQQYMRTPAHIRENAAYLREDFPGARLCFFGHSHAQKVYRLDGEEVVEVPLSGGDVALEKDRTYFINPGSVDAQRKRERKLAECAILDTLGWSIEFLRLPYDAASTEAKAAVFGYRITGATDRLYDLGRRARRIASRLTRRAAT
jgi:predicted phosphodiesterase